MTCEDKIKYPTEEHAYRKKRIQARRGIVNLRCYPCPECGAWHLTHQPIK